MTEFVCLAAGALAGAGFMGWLLGGDIRDERLTLARTRRNLERAELRLARMLEDPVYYCEQRQRMAAGGPH